jgi:tRNA uridine 5-carboxymethylaminomethyl modification enzyme
MLVGTLDVGTPDVKQFDVIVVGAGHAGIEAALASARKGRKTACVTLDLARIGHLPCNCSIGGPAKGHIAREVDALGGQMGLTTDRALTHIRRVGTGKGPAVQTVRAHVCKSLYPQIMQEVMASEPNLTLMQGAVETVLDEQGRVAGVIVLPKPGAHPSEGERIATRSVVLTTGTFLNGLCHEGSNKTVAARHGDQAVSGLSAFLRNLGVHLRRFKTGTTPRIRLSSIDLTKTQHLDSEPEAGPLSFMSDRIQPLHELLPCWQTRTVSATHEILAERLHESAMYSGQIEGVGPRYCPSIEDKIVRFADKETHPIFLEQEEWENESVYVQGFSTSLPADTQLLALRSIPSLEQVEMIRPGYAVEYDMADPLQLTPTLMSQLMPGLFLAGQLNGTSGYEEAAGQGIVAGINAARFASGEEEVLFPRDNSFIGVMIDDLVTKGVDDPYRMLTARSEHRLLLRHDNADRRLTPIAHKIGLASEERWARLESKEEMISRGITSLRSTSVTPASNHALEAREWPTVNGKVSLYELMRRPEVSLKDVQWLAEDLGLDLQLPQDAQALEQIELTAVYEGYLQKQERLAAEARKLDSMRIPQELDYETMKGLSYESIEKLGRVRPTTIGQASRVPGVRPADIALLIGHLNARQRS